MMSIVEYKNEVKRILTNDYGIEESYVNKISKHIGRSYKDGVKLTETTGVDHINPDGYCYGIFMIYPDLP